MRKGNPERTIMNVNGITTMPRESYTPSHKQVTPEQNVPAKEKLSIGQGKGVVYEPTLEIPTETYKANEQFISEMRRNARNRVDELQQIEMQLINDK